MKTARIIAISFIFGAIILVVGTFFLREYTPTTVNQNAAATPQPARTEPGSDNPFIAEATKPSQNPSEFEGRHWIDNAFTTFSRLLLAVLLSGVLAFRPRKDIPLFRRSLFVSQTQILLAVVAAALMLIVGDNTARAFAIFAAVSLVRFRTNIRDPKEITVLLISLALGLAAGVGHWELGISLCLFALALLWLLEYNESEQVFRSMELTVKTREPEHTQMVLKKIFKGMKLDAEVREFEPPDEKKPLGSIVYFLNLRLKLSTDFVSDRIMAADPNIEGIQWSKSKGSSDIYQ
jgi:uncharacterized membrane protein YhiD involved in acid resistance